MSLRIWLVKDGESVHMDSSVKRQRVAMLADALREAGHHVDWWTSTHHHFTKALLHAGDHQATTPSGVNVHYLSCGSYRRNLSAARIMHHRRFAEKLRAAFSTQEKPDVIVVCYPIIEAAVECLRYGRTHGIPVIVDVRDQWPDTFVNYVPPLAKPIVRLLNRILFPNDAWVLRNADYLTSMSTNVLEWAIAKSGRARTQEEAEVFYLSTDLDPAALDGEPGGADRLLDLPKDRLIYTYLGTFNNTADLGTLADAIIRLQQTGLRDRLAFVLAGDGDLMPILKEKLGGIAHVYFTGWLKKVPCHQLLRQSDVAFLTGINEAMPNKIFDYISYGLPMICSLRGESRSFIKAHAIGETCPSGDPDALVAAIRTIAERGILDYRAAIAALPPGLYQSKAVYQRFTRFIERAASAMDMPQA